MLGAMIGLRVAARRPATRLPDGRLALAGDWLPLLLFMTIFVVRYAAGVATGIDPSLASDPVFRTVSLFLSGLFAAMMIARTVGALPTGTFLPSRVGVAPASADGAGVRAAAGLPQRSRG